MSESAEKASSLILDTSVIIDAFRGNDLIRQQLESAGVLYLPSIVVGELHRGLYKSQKADEGRAKIARLQSVSIGLDVDAHTGEYFAVVDSALAQKGRPIPDNDVWIAALALQHGLCLFTKDKHFKEVDGLKLLMP